MREGRRADAVETGARVCRRRRRRRGRAGQFLYELSEIALVYVIYWRLLLLLLLIVAAAVVRCVVEMEMVMRFGDFVRCFVEEMEMVCCLISVVAAAAISSVGVGIWTRIRVFLHVWLSYLELLCHVYIYTHDCGLPLCFFI